MLFCPLLKPAKLLSLNHQLSTGALSHDHQGDHHGSAINISERRLFLRLPLGNWKCIGKKLSLTLKILTSGQISKAKGRRKGC